MYFPLSAVVFLEEKSKKSYCRQSGLEENEGHFLKVPETLGMFQSLSVMRNFAKQQKTNEKNNFYTFHRSLAFL